MNESTWWLSEDATHAIHHKLTTNNGVEHSITDLIHEHISCLVEVGWNNLLNDFNISVEGEWLAHPVAWDGIVEAAIDVCNCDPECEASFDVVTIRLVPKKG
jgi:hypothetical protein